VRLVTNGVGFDIDIDTTPWSQIRDAVEKILDSELTRDDSVTQSTPIMTPVHLSPTSSSPTSSLLTFRCHNISDQEITTMFTKLFSPTFLRDPLLSGWTVLINTPHVDDMRTVFDPSKTIVLRMEPECDLSEDVYWEGWLGRYFPNRNGGYDRSIKSTFAFWGDNHHHLNTIEWHLNISLEELLIKDWKKERLSTETTDGLLHPVSAICSSKSFMDGHKWRLEFMRKWYDRTDPDSPHSSSSGSPLPPLHLWGRDGDLGMPRVYRGVLQTHDKTLALSEYQYTFACENCVRSNYVTEKLWDALMTDTLCFYYGPDVSPWVEPHAVIQLDANHDRALEQMSQVVRANQFHTLHLPAIQRTRQQLLTRWSLQCRVRDVVLWKTIDPRIVVLNLPRRTDRRQLFQQRAQQVGLFPTQYEWFEATEGVNRNDWPQYIDAENARVLRVGEVGVISSHCRIWQEVVQTNRACLVFEDDVMFGSGDVDLSTLTFWDQLWSAFSRLPDHWEWACIGWYKASSPDRNYETNRNTAHWIKLSDLHRDRLHADVGHDNWGFGSFGGGAFAYFISPQGAQQLLSKKCIHPIDYHVSDMTKQGITPNTYAYSMPLVSAVTAHVNNQEDTDIQRSDFVLLGDVQQHKYKHLLTPRQ